MWLVAVCVLAQLNPWLVAISKWSAWRQGVSSHTQFTCGNLFAADVSDCDVIMVFGVKPLMERCATVCWLPRYRCDVALMMPRCLTSMQCNAQASGQAEC